MGGFPGVGVVTLSSHGNGLHVTLLTFNFKFIQGLFLHGIATRYFNEKIELVGPSRTLDTCIGSGHFINASVGQGALACLGRKW